MIGYTWGSKPGVKLEVHEGRCEEEVELRIITEVEQVDSVRVNRDALLNMLRVAPQQNAAPRPLRGG